MEYNLKLAAVGQKEAVLSLKALGMIVIPTNTKEETIKAIHSLKKDGIKIIFITEEEAIAAKEVLDYYRADSDISIIPIPGTLGSKGYALQSVRDNVEKALGADILFNNKN